MPFCPYCAFSMPCRDSRADCPNCGRRKVKLRPTQPSIASSVTPYQSKETSKASIICNLLTAGMISLSGIACLFIGILMRTPMGGIFSLTGIVAFLAGILYFNTLRKDLRRDKHPVKGYIEHLDDLQNSRHALSAKIDTLQDLLSRQESHKSPRSDNRERLLNAALENRYQKLQLVEETEFIIESKRKLAHLQALTQALSSNQDLIEQQKLLDHAFADLIEWHRQAPECRTNSGKQTQQAMQQVIGLYSDITDQIEDQLVVQTLEEQDDSTENLTLARVHAFFEQTALTDDFNALEMGESAANDEEFISINTELRLLKDGITSDLSTDPMIDFKAPDDQVDQLSD